MKRIEGEAVSCRGVYAIFSLDAGRQTLCNDEMNPLKEAIRSWELYRLPFNLVLFVLGLMWSWPLRATMKEEAFFGYWGSVLAFGVTANVFYTLGPALEAYWLAFRGCGFGQWRRGFWAGGLAVSLFMTWGFVWSMEILYIVLYPSRA